MFQLACCWGKFAFGAFCQNAFIFFPFYIIFSTWLSFGLDSKILGYISHVLVRVQKQTSPMFIWLRGALPCKSGCLFFFHYEIKHLTMKLEKRYYIHVYTLLQSP